MTRANDDARARGAAAARALRRGSWTGLDQASVMGVELLAATLTWAGVGWLVDRWLGTAPWFLAIGALIGNGAGLYLVWLRGSRMQAREERVAAEVERSSGSAT
jgi:ATP synthase protein I